MTEEEFTLQLGREIDLRDKAYTERNLCVALVAALAEMSGFHVGLGSHEGEDWEDDWRTILFLDLPTGQVSWHLHDSELENFSGIGKYLTAWDGHTTEEKYERVKRFTHLGVPPLPRYEG